MMSKEIFLLFLINVFSAIGYSLIAPLYPIEAKLRGVRENLCGLVISMFAIANFFLTPFCPRLIGKYGRKRMFYIACILEASSTLMYGLLQYFTNYYAFLIISVITRILHGIGASISATLVYSVSATICEPSQVKTTLGLMEVAWCLGIALGPMCASGFFYIGGYMCPFMVCGLAIYCCIPFIYNLQLPEEEESEVPPFLNALMDISIMSITFTVVMDIFCKTFYFPTLTNHLINNYGLSIEMSSFFFIISMSSYFALINFLNPITHKLGLKLTIIVGMIFLTIGVLLLGPIPILPQSTITISIGMILLGVSGVTINVPAICDLIETLKVNSKGLDQNTANDMASAIYNLGLNFGEAIGPTFGGYVTDRNDFPTSCVYTSIIVMTYCVFFTIIHYRTIIQDLEDGKLPYPEIDNNKKNLAKPLLGIEEAFSLEKADVVEYRSYAGRFFRNQTYSRSSKKSYSKSFDVYLLK